MVHYFLDGKTIPEGDAATAWFDYAENHGIDIPKAISLWEDAATVEGEASRQRVAPAGIRIVFKEGGGL